MKQISPTVAAGLRRSTSLEVLVLQTSGGAVATGLSWGMTDGLSDDLGTDDLGTVNDYGNADDDGTKAGDGTAALMVLGLVMVLMMMPPRLVMVLLILVAKPW